MLAVVTLIWGTTFVLTRGLETRRAGAVEPSLLIALRFLLAAIVCSPWLMRRRARNRRAPRGSATAGPATRSDRGLWRVGLELGFWLCCGYAAQAIGLAMTSSGRSAFVTSLNVVFVPAFASLAGRTIGVRVWASAAMALLGTALLCNDAGRFNAGDAWTLVTAVTYAVYILRLERYAPRFAPSALTAVQLWAVAGYAAVWAGAAWLRHGGAGFGWSAIPGIAWVQIAYLGIVATAATTWLQAIGQRTVPGPQAALLYTMEPVWASVFAWIGAGEILGPAGWAGAGMILLAAVVSQSRATDRPAPAPVSIASRDDAHRLL